MTRTIDPDLEADEAADLLCDLVAIDSRNPPGKERACAEFVHEWLTEWDIDAEFVREPFAERPQVIARLGRAGPGTRTLVLNGHMDVVSPGDRDEWSYDPFEGVVDDGRVYGRGASDMKSGLTAALLAARAAARSDALDGELVLTFAVGEETGDPGTLRLVEDLDADFGVVLEPTELVVDTAGKGLAWYTLDVRGEQSHASKPHLGTNALAGVLSLSDEIEAYQKRLAERTHPLLGSALCTPTVCSTGETQNVVPGEAELRFDRRMLPGEDTADVDDQMAAFAETLRERGCDASVTRMTLYEAAEIPTDAEIARVFRRHANDVAGVDTAPHGKTAATDQRYLVNDAGVPTIIWGPGSPSQAHAVDEWARTDLLEDAIDVLCRSFEELLVES